MNIKNGTLTWKLKTNKAIVASPVIDQNQVFIGSSEGTFRALNLKNGVQIWEFNQVNGFIETTPCYDADRVYFGAWGTYFYALNKKDGSLAWKWNNGSANRLYSPGSCHPVVANGRVFIVAPDRFATALDATTGKQLWRSTPRIGRESIALSADQSMIYTKSMQDTLYAISATSDNFEIKWLLHTNFGYDISPAPCIEKEGIIYLPTDKGLIFAIDRKQRSVLWTHKLSNALINNIVPLDNHEILTSSMDGGVFRLKYKME